MNQKKHEKATALPLRLECTLTVLSPDRLIHTHTDSVGRYGVRVSLKEELVIYDIVGLELFVKRHQPLVCEARVVLVLKKENPQDNLPPTFETVLSFLNMNMEDKKYLREMVEESLQHKEGQINKPQTH